MSAYGSFHGRTLATLHATGQPAKHEAFQPLPEGFRHVAWDDLDALAAAIDPTVAAVLLEPVQGEGGVNPATAEYFHGVRELCDERGVLFMVDEVQTGLGRTGAWFAHHHFGVEPDVDHHGQGARQRRPHRCLLGQAGGRRGLPARRPRHDLRRHADRHRRGQGRAGRARAHRRAGRGTAGGRPADGRPGADAGCVRRSRPRPADRRRARRGDRRQGRGGGVPRRRAGGQRRDTHRAAVRAAAQRERRGDRRGRRPPGEGARRPGRRIVWTGRLVAEGVR